MVDGRVFISGRKSVRYRTIAHMKGICKAHVTFLSSTPLLSEISQLATFSVIIFQQDVAR